MRLDVAIARSLVAWGRPGVRGEIPLDGFDRFATARRWARRCVIETPGARFEDAASWLGSLRAAGLLPELGPELALESRGPDGATTFQLALDNVIPQPTEGGLFDVTFRFGGPRKLEAAGELGVEAATHALAAALEGLVALGKRADLGGWQQNFEQTLAKLRGGPDADWQGVPPTAPPAVRALALAAERADVFGGMGSWNDFWLQEPNLESERSTCSSALYDAMRAAVRASANAC